MHIEMLAPQKRHDDDLLPAIDRLFTRLKLGPNDLRNGAVALSIGPGGFTGLRIAVATAKMFAETLNTKLVAVPSALVAAESCREVGPIMVALSSKDDSAWCAVVERTPPANNWSIRSQPRIDDGQSLDLSCGGIQAILADEHFPPSMRDRAHEARIPIIPPIFDPRACLLVGQRMLAHNLVAEPLALTPLYPRQPEAVTLWDKRKGAL